MGWSMHENKRLDDVVKLELEGLTVLDRARTREASVTCEWARVQTREGARIVLLICDAYAKGWAVKCLSELDGPYFYSCPTRLFAGDAPDAGNKEWRERVRQHAA